MSRNTWEWINAPISPTCEHQYARNKCCNPTSHAYPAMNRGWMALCPFHAHQHLAYAKPIEELLKQGETLAPPTPSAGT